MKPRPKPVDTSRLADLSREVMTGAPFPMLASQDGDQPRLRPVSPVRTDGFTVYIASLRRYHKTSEIAANPNVELCYLDEEHNQVRITGRATVLGDAGLDAALKQEIWDSNPLLRQYLGSPDNPELIIYRVDPNHVRYMREWALEYYEVPLEDGAQEAARL